MNVLIVTGVALAMAIGIFGTVFPLIPGLPIVWGAALAYGLVEGFDTVGWVCFGIITALFVGGMGAGVALPKRRLDAAGAPRSTIFAAFALGVIGFFVIPVVGLPLGAALGVWLSERGRLGNSAAAWDSTKSLLIGFGTGALAQMGAGFAMAFVWVIWVISG